MAPGDNYSRVAPIGDFQLWEKLRYKRSLSSLEFEITPRCNNNCTHCYINLPANDKLSRSMELTINEIGKIADEAVKLGVYTALITGGEPLLRTDFLEIFMLLKKKGFIVSVFTNATLIKQKHIDLFKKYPPRNIEVSVYGVSEKTYEAISRIPGTFRSFMNGVDLIAKNNIPVRFKAMALRSNIHELDKISEFCRERTKDYFRFDPQLHLRYDMDKKRNREIQSERLSAEEISVIEQADKERSEYLVENRDKYIYDSVLRSGGNNLFSCGIGNGSLTIGYDGNIRGCSSMIHKKMIYDWRNGTLAKAWEKFFPALLDLKTLNKKILEKCRSCNIVNLCMSCPAHNYLESGDPDSFTEYFCKVAHARAEKLNSAKKNFKNEGVRNDRENKF